jgi:uncharacterized protein YaeQ
MALPATLRRFELDLTDTDRGVYEHFDWRVAQHPSESERYLVARVLARALEHGDGMDFNKGGVSDDTDPAICQRDLRGDWVAWIEVGTPAADRLHKASKVSPRVVVYTWKNPPLLVAEIGEFGVFRKEELEINALDPGFLDEVSAGLDRVNRWELSVSGGSLYLTANGKGFESAVQRLAVD